MTKNFDKYIEKVLENCYDAVYDGKPCDCTEITCDVCDIFCSDMESTCCSYEFLKWLNEEYEEEDKTKDVNSAEIL